jgi:hypothetical protein
MIYITVALDDDMENINESEEQMINAIEDAFASANILKESVAAEVIDVDWG